MVDDSSSRVGGDGVTTCYGLMMRIISLLPSATEIICPLGLEDQLVGVTPECDDPSAALQLPKVTHTLIPKEVTSGEFDRLVREQLKTTRALYTLNLPLLKELRPDLIVTQSLCNVCTVAQDEVQAALSQLPGSPHVINLEPQSLSDVFAAMRQVAVAAGVSAEAVIQSLTARVDAVSAVNHAGPSSRRGPAGMARSPVFMWSLEP